MPDQSQVLEAIILFTWMAVTVAGCWLIWRLAYEQGRDETGSGTCCRGGHHDPQIPMPTPDEWDSVIEEILDEASSKGRRAPITPS